MTMCVVKQTMTLFPLRVHVMVLCSILSGAHEREREEYDTTIHSFKFKNLPMFNSRRHVTKVSQYDLSVGSIVLRSHLENEAETV